MKHIIKKLGIALFAMALLWSCGKDDGTTPPADKNTAPVMAAQEFSAKEDITPADAIGTVAATDADNDALTFSIKANDNALFSISSAGALTLAASKALDFETKTQHSITVSVSDGTDTTDAAITIKVEDVDEVVPTENTAPEFSYANEFNVGEFTVMEDIADTDVIGTIIATDADGDTLTFTLTSDADGVFEITTEGELSLAPGKSLDFETTTGYQITVQVSDGQDMVEGDVNILVEDVDENIVIDPADDPDAFVTTWKTDADNEQIVIGTNNAYSYNYTIDWGDGTGEQITSNEPISHIYATAGTYTVAIKGVFPAIRYINGVTTSSKLMSIEQWGTIAWRTMQNAFANCTNMVYNATDTPDLSQLTNMSNTFLNANAFNGAIGDWDTSNAVHMTGMFKGANVFNQDIGGWDTSGVTNMSEMFRDATAFNQNIGNWNIGSVNTMANMLNNSGMNAVSYGATLVGWAGQPNAPSNISLGAIGLSIDCNSLAHSNARATLLAERSWTISDSPCN